MQSWRAFIKFIIGEVVKFELETWGIKSTEREMGREKSEVRTLTHDWSTFTKNSNRFILDPLILDKNTMISYLKTLQHFKKVTIFEQALFQRGYRWNVFKKYEKRLVSHKDFHFLEKWHFWKTISFVKTRKDGPLNIWHNWTIFRLLQSTH